MKSLMRLIQRAMADLHIFIIRGIYIFISKLDKTDKENGAGCLQPFQQDYNFELASFRQVSNGEYLVSCNSNSWQYLQQNSCLPDTYGCRREFLWVKQIDSLWTAGSLTLDDAIQERTEILCQWNKKKDLHNSNSFLITVDIPEIPFAKTSPIIITPILFYMKPKTLHCGFVENTLQPMNFLLKYYHGAEQGFYILNITWKRSFCSRYAWRTGWRNLYRRQQWFYCLKTDFYSKVFSHPIYWIHVKENTNQQQLLQFCYSFCGWRISFAGTSSGDSTANGRNCSYTQWIQNNFNETGCRKEYQMVLCLWNYGSEGIAVSKNKWWHPDNPVTRWILEIWIQRIWLPSKQK